MFVLGVDPGLTRCGYCCIEVSGRDTRAVTLGVLSTPPADPVPDRLAALQLGMRRLLTEHRPEVVAIERVLFQVNVRTAMAVGQASGIVMAEAVQQGAAVVEYSPNQVKETVAGWGAAPKAQMQQMVQMLLGLDRLPQPADAADAAAVALCHAAMAPTTTAIAALVAGSGAPDSRGRPVGRSSARSGAGGIGGGAVRNRVRRPAATSAPTSTRTRGEAP